MASLLTDTKPTFTVSPMEKSVHEKHDFGAVIDGVDLENIIGGENLTLRPIYADWDIDSDVKALAAAIWTHKLIVVKGQQHVRPIKQWELVTRFDPDAPLVHSHGDLQTFNKQGGLLSVRLSAMGPKISNN